MWDLCTNVGWKMYSKKRGRAPQDANEEAPPSRCGFVTALTVGCRHDQVLVIGGRPVIV